ncbi:Aste57867_17221 [Aphanomyces stellatus]|uniref:Aste57867_17221 protein n=1 Tax=Aphanomyces stellatus TaxID=120398 RepID=A0A485L8Y3_9STRA|nr:hypothetical protein As57867_017162 [Aphanomyces stellatus]VFT93978.1 Aste57867_17221 [Aphanomyces stellatus]
MLSFFAFALVSLASVGALTNAVTHTDVVAGILHDSASHPVPDNWVTQPLDHTNASNPYTWKQRYHYNNAWVRRADAPVYVFLNGEGPAAASTPTSPALFLNELAAKHGAWVVSVEHRFYGESQPTGDFSTASLAYLTIHQALADLATLQDHFIATQHNMTKANKWVLFGGSYAGLVAGFAKSKYPTRFAGAVASSAPVWTKVDFFEYADVVADAIQTIGGDACTHTVAEGIQDLHALLASNVPADAATLANLFNLCSPVTNDKDCALVEATVFTTFQNLVQFNNLAVGADTVASMCAAFVAQTTWTPLEKVAAFTRRRQHPCTSSSLDMHYLPLLANTTVSTTSAIRQWTYQLCAELGFAQTTAGATSYWHALSYYTLDVTAHVCAQVFGITDSVARTQSTQDTYGGLAIDVPNVVWINGNLDPWHALGFSNETTHMPVNPASRVVFVDGTSHCADVYSCTYKTVPQAVHDEIERSVLAFLGQ